jgi:nitrogen-specific signal transduction histidine kinase
MNEVSRVTLDRLYDDAQKIIDAREEILGIVAHDLRNPLNTIHMATELLIEEPGPETARVSQLRIIQRSGERMNRLIQDLLSVTTIEAGRLSIAPRKVTVPDLFREAAETLEPMAREKSIAFNVMAADDLPAVRADPARVQQVLSNLVGNALKFTPAGGSITLSAARTDGPVQCSVTDTGPGIPAAQIPRLFGKFWQAKRGDGRGVPAIEGLGYRQQPSRTHDGCNRVQRFHCGHETRRFEACHDPTQRFGDGGDRHHPSSARLGSDRAHEGHDGPIHRRKSKRAGPADVVEENIAGVDYLIPNQASFRG